MPIGKKNIACKILFCTEIVYLVSLLKTIFYETLNMQFHRKSTGISLELRISSNLYFFLTPVLKIIIF